MNPAGPDTQVVTRVVTDFRLAQARESRLAWYFAGAYLLVIVYASLSPFTGWSSPGAPALAFLDEPWPRRLPRFDLIVNVIAYVPLGLLLTLAAMRWMRPILAVALALVIGTSMSFGLETAQMYLPVRVASSIDLMLNSAGTALGALLAARTGRMPLWGHFRDLRVHCCLPASIADPGLALIAIWFLTQVDPSLPLLSALSLPDALPIPGTDFTPPRAFSVPSAIAVAINTLAISLFVMALMRKRWHALIAMCTLVATAALIKLAAGVVMLKAQSVFIWLSMEVVLGIAAGTAVSALMLALPRTMMIRIGIAALVCSFLSIHLFQDATQPVLALAPFRWTYGQLLNYTGLARTVADLWPIVGAWYLVVLRRKLRASARAEEGTLARQDEVG
ncbi:MAG: VanZ family protein [Proteobacteria bacterium]|nr:VanZ family protein [Burkholderiales bacterium]